MPTPLRIGLISDTHGLLRPEATAFLAGSDHIIHAGDVCEQRILDELATIAPLTAVRGNNDSGPWAQRLRETERIAFGDVVVYVIHDLAALDIEPRAAGLQVVISGHSHKPLIRRDGDVLYVNPGSAGRRRFRLPITAAELLIDGSTVTAHIHQLAPT